MIQDRPPPVTPSSRISASRERSLVDAAGDAIDDTAAAGGGDAVACVEWVAAGNAIQSWWLAAGFDVVGSGADVKKSSPVAAEAGGAIGRVAELAALVDVAAEKKSN